MVIHRRIYDVEDAFRRGLRDLKTHAVRLADPELELTLICPGQQVLADDQVTAHCPCKSQDNINRYDQLPPAHPFSDSGDQPELPPVEKAVALGMGGLLRAMLLQLRL